MRITPKDPERAPRFALEVPMRYRVKGQAAWHEGKTENISRSGMLFRGQFVVNPNTSVEMSFSLPAHAPNEPAAEVVCSGHVVRTVQAQGARGLPAFGARIWDYRFIRGQTIAGS